MRRLHQLSHATLEERRLKDDENWEDYKMNSTVIIDFEAWGMGCTQNGKRGVEVKRLLYIISTENNLA